MASLQLNTEQKKTLLGIAKKTITSAVNKKSIPDFKITDDALNLRYGAFVTIHKNGNLRGCIGNIIGTAALYKTIIKMAVEAALHDPRFGPVMPGELDDIDIEISVLSPFEKITDTSKIEVGVHGLFIKNGYDQGLLLPQVATEYNWDRKEFLEHTCQKAGLPRDCYMRENCEIFIFSATVFGEKDLASDPG
jgi:AmmeMemoRadiSam system protein A